MNRIESPERMPSDHVTGQSEHIVVQVDANPRLPFMLEPPAGQRVLRARQIAGAMSSSEGGVSLGVRDLGGRHRPMPADQRVNHVGSRFGDKPLEQRARIEVGHRRSSMTVLEMSPPRILTARMRFKGFRVGSVTRPWAASAARRASRLPTCLADVIGVSRAMGLPRSVTMISSPCLVRRKYRVRPFLSSLTPTVAMLSPCSYS